LTLYRDRLQKEADTPTQQVAFFNGLPAIRFINGLIAVISGHETNG